MKTALNIKAILQVFASFIFSITLVACASFNRTTPTKLSDLQIARVNQAYSSLESEFSEWGLEKHGQDCLLLFSDREQWLVGCQPSNMPDFRPTGQQVRKSSVLWIDKSFYFSGSTIPYEKIKLDLVGTVGSYKAADASIKPLLMLQDWTVLRANHPGFKNSPLEEWLAVFVHEAFHARQLWHPAIQARLAKMAERPLASAQDLMNFYLKNTEFKKYIQNEHQLLSAATDRDDLTPTQAKRVLKEWLKLYKKREKSFALELERAYPGKKAWEMDGFLTFLEGTARYVEAKYLLVGAAESSELIADSTYQNFALSHNKKPSELVGLGNIGAKYFYSLGMHLSFLLDRASPGWKKEVWVHDELLLGKIKRVIK